MAKCGVIHYRICLCRTLSNVGLGSDKKEVVENEAVEKLKEAVEQPKDAVEKPKEVFEQPREVTKPRIQRKSGKKLQLIKRVNLSLSFSMSSHWRDYWA